MLARYGVAVLVCDLCLYYYDLYDPRVVDSRSILTANLLKALGVACVALAILYYLIPSLRLGRGVAVLAAPSVLILIVGWRLLLAVLAPLLCDLYEDGIPLKDIEALTGVHRKVVWSFAKKAGLPMRLAARKAHVEGAV